MAKFVDVYGFLDDADELDKMDNLIKVVEVGEDNFEKYHQIDKEIDLADYIVKGEEKPQEKKFNFDESKIIDAKAEVVEEREDGQFADLKYNSEYEDGLNDIIDSETIDALENECGI